MVRTRSLVPFAAPLLLSLACAHAPPAAPAAENKAPPAAAPQLKAASKPADEAVKPDLASGQAELDAALRKLSGVSVFFSFDEARLTPEAEGRLAEVGEVLRQHEKLTVRIEGNCDERGTEAYNLALGQRRAEAARRYLQQMGAREAQVAAVSFGAEKPKVAGHDESAWSQNRRDDVVPR
jgi:peptidoglycan-associated lipoprotein